MRLDTIEIKGLRVFAYHGVFDQEQRDGQLFVINVSLSLDLRSAGRADDLTATVDYAELSRELAEAATSTRFDLIEALAEHLAGLVLQHERVHTVRVRVSKPDASLPVDVDDVAVAVHRP